MVSIETSPTPSSRTDIAGVTKTSGWTLQELVAPQRIRFFDKQWRKNGSKASWGPDLARITGIALECLQDPRKIKCYPIAQRLHWAAQRQTTRIEDEAYCLMGIMGVNMPLLYGEGNRAFARLCTELIRQSDDVSIFNHDERFNVIPCSALAYTSSAYSIPLPNTLGRPRTINRPSFSVSNKGLILSNMFHIELNPFITGSEYTPLSEGTERFKGEDYNNTPMNLRIRLIALPNDCNTSYLLAIGQTDGLYGDWMKIDVPFLSSDLSTDDDLARHFVEHGRFSDEDHCIRSPPYTMRHNWWNRQATGVEFRCCPNSERGPAAVDF
jgi:hypothetical protein